MFAINEKIKKPTKRNQTKTELPDTAFGRCANRDCGTVLFDNADAVPGGWIIIWHVNCGGYCPECALELSAETMLIWGIDPTAQAKAQLILETFPANASNPTKDEEGDDNQNDDDDSDEWADF